MRQVEKTKEDNAGAMFAFRITPADRKAVMAKMDADNCPTISVLLTTLIRLYLSGAVQIKPATAEIVTISK